jgi:hypothetical protein
MRSDGGFPKGEVRLAIPTTGLTASSLKIALLFPS